MLFYDPTPDSLLKKIIYCFRTYYKNQDELITTFEDFHFGVDDAMKHTEEMEERRKKANILAKITLVANVVCTHI